MNGMWNITVNTEEKIVIFSRGKVRKYPIFKFDDSNIGVVQDYVHLWSEIEL